MILYNSTLKLFNLTAATEDSDNIYVPGTLQYTNQTIDADVQPYSAELLKKAYGYDVEVTKRIFVDLNNNIVVGSVLKLDDNNAWEVRKIIGPWSDYMELMCMDTEVPTDG